MIDIDKMNDCLRAGLINPKAQSICDKGFDQIAEFTNNHMTDAAGELIKEPGTKFDRGEIINLFMEDIHKKIFPQRTERNSK